MRDWDIAQWFHPMPASTFSPKWLASASRDIPPGFIDQQFSSKGFTRKGSSYWLLWLLLASAAAVAEHASCSASRSTCSVT